MTTPQDEAREIVYTIYNGQNHTQDLINRIAKALQSKQDLIDQMKYSDLCVCCDENKKRMKK